MEAQAFIATFYSHFAAMQFKKTAPADLTALQLMPVPRDLSSSCGTCVRFSATAAAVEALVLSDETEQIVVVVENGYRVVKDNRE